MGQLLKAFTFDRNNLKRSELQSAQELAHMIEVIEREQALDKTNSNKVGAFANYMGLFEKIDDDYVSTDLAEDFQRLYQLEPADAWRWLITRSLWKYVVPNGTQSPLNRTAQELNISFNFFTTLLGLLLQLQAFPGNMRFLYYSELCILFDPDENWSLSSFELLTLLQQMREQTGYTPTLQGFLGDLEVEYGLPKDNLNTIFRKGFGQTGLFEYLEHQDTPIGITIRQGLTPVLQGRIRHILDNPPEWIPELQSWKDFLLSRNSDLPVEVSPLSAATSEDMISEPVTETQSEYSLEEFERQTGFPKSLLEQWKRHLDRRMHIVFQGPPGTGKTFIAQKLAQLKVSNTNGFSDVVQFHPSYSYEDFMRGLRPTVDDDGNLTYEPQDGRFLEFCRRARVREKDNDPCVLIIDEINRANLSRVFGELMYLLEYRDQSIPLAYGGQPFRIPKNVYLIGTMNTADRSIALVDFALRRRFSFIRLAPNYDVLQKHLQSQPELATALLLVLNKINETIELPDYQIGTAFFLKPSPEELPRMLRDIWETEIEPYLEEFFYDQPAKVAPFRWESLTKNGFGEIGALPS